MSVESPVRLTLDSRGDYSPARPFLVRVLWLFANALFLVNPLVTSYRLKRAVLRVFGARIGGDVVIKPSVHIKYPWFLEVGDNCWIGERAWIDNFVAVSLASNVCISQGAYLCTGNHDWSDVHMPLAPRPIKMEEGAWVGAFARVAPGVVVGADAVLCLGAVLLEDAEPRGIYAGNPATRVGTRMFRGSE